MTSSVYPLSISKSSEREDADYMDINPDEVEAGSILMSLSQHTKRNNTPKPTTNTMSIRNLLDDEDQTRPSIQSKMDVHMFTSQQPSVTEDMHRYPETNKVPISYPERMQHNVDNMHVTTTSSQAATASSSSSAATFSIRSNSVSGQRASESYDWQQQQQQQQLQQQQQYHHFQQQRPSSYPHFTQQPQQIPPKATFPRQQQPYHQHNQPPYSQQSFQSMRNNPEVRRNALHAYISYMTYSDLTRQKLNRPATHPYTNNSSTVRPFDVTSEQPITSMQKGSSHSLPPPAPASSQDPRCPPPLHHHRQQPPLTAFLKQSVDHSIPPTTPLPQQQHLHVQQQRQQQQQHLSSSSTSGNTNWSPHHRYQSPPPPSTTQPQYQYPHPRLSYPPPPPFASSNTLKNDHSK